MCSPDSVRCRCYRLDRTQRRGRPDSNAPDTVSWSTASAPRLRAGRRAAASRSLEHRRRLRVPGRQFVRRPRRRARRGPASAKCPSTPCRCGTPMTSRVWGAGLGVIRRTDMFAANVDRQRRRAARLHARGRRRLLHVTTGRPLQANVENLFDASTTRTPTNNTNITPGSPRALRVSVNTAFF